MIRTQIQLREDQSEELRLLALREGVSLAELVRRGVDRVLADAGTEPGKNRLDALGVAGRFDSGVPGVAREHDEELVRAYMQSASRTEESTR